MESWLPAIFGFGGVLVGSFFSLWLTKLQLNNSDKRLDREFSKAREDAQRQRRWEVRGEPLLKLRTELALMAAKLERVVAAVYKLPTKTGIIPDEQARGLIEAQVDWNTHVASGDLRQTLFLQFDAELVIKTKEILFDFLVSAHEVLGVTKTEEVKEVLEKNRTRIVEIQELINKRLEEL